MHKCINAAEIRVDSKKMKLTKTFIICLILTLMLLEIEYNHSNSLFWFLEVSKKSETSRENLLGGLLSSDFDEDSCLSRYQSLLYRKPSPFEPSKHLISELRNYEMLHKNCGPGTKAYKKAIKKLDLDEDVSSFREECQYIVWIPLAGLGNRILSLTSAFLYAILTKRVLLIDSKKDLNDLFCEPFPGTSWLLPLDFPLFDQLDEFSQQSSRSYGTILKNQTVNLSKRIPPYLYLHLVHDYKDCDQMFFCKKDQIQIKKVPWLIIKSDNYFIPALWLIPSFETELVKLFPQKDTVFHHLVRYIIHPTNRVWGMITRSYNGYLSRADERLGIQIRVFQPGTGPFMDQITSCIQKEKLLPELNTQETEITSRKRTSKLKAVLITSLTSDFAENLRSKYLEYPTLTGDIVVIHQPSQERYQQSEKKLHNRKALAEIYLLSMTDSLVTSAWSTFGYVAQGLGGLKPRMLYKSQNRTVPDPPCTQAISMEPCFHSPPYFYCKDKTGTKIGNIVPYVKYCEDRSSGIKLFEVPDEL